MNNENNRENREINFILMDNNDQKVDREHNKKQISHYYSGETNNRAKNIKRRKGLLSYFIVALIAALIGGLISSYIAPTYLYGNILPVPRFYENGNNGQEINIVTNGQIGAVQAVAKKTTKSVVGITTIRIAEQEIWFWKVPVKMQGLGSGVIVSSDGYIITNSHVVSNGQVDEITVLLEDGTKKPGEVLWFSRIYDLAVVKVDASNLTVAELGDSDTLEVGELAVAIGNPLGLEFQRTVTSGVISGLNRTIEVEDELNLNEKIKMENLIQTDASINPGNSGGPLLNSKGEVIGINTAKITSGEGLGLAIPINVVKPIISQIIDEGEFKQVYLGIRGLAVEKYEQAVGIDLTADKGIYIAEVLANSPAQRGGLQAGDILIEIDGKEVNSMNELSKRLYEYKPGDTGDIKILRNGEKKKLQVTFIERQD